MARVSSNSASTTSAPAARKGPIRRLYDWVLSWADTRYAVAALFVLAFAESSFFPIPPHPLLGLMCLAEPKKAVKFALVATLASVAGALLGYAIGWGLYDTVGVWLIGALGLTEAFPIAACHLIIIHSSIKQSII